MSATTDTGFETAENTLSKIRTNAHPKCVVCSFGNEQGLRIEFQFVEQNRVEAVFTFDKSFEGYPGILHGGVITSILDGAMGNCMFARGQTAVTVEITTRFRHPVLTDKPAFVTAWLEKNAHPLYLLKAQILQDGKIRAAAKGKFYDQPKLLNAD